jgi:hypothetical protein
MKIRKKPKFDRTKTVENHRHQEENSILNPHPKCWNLQSNVVKLSNHKVDIRKTHGFVFLQFEIPISRDSLVFLSVSLCV